MRSEQFVLALRQVVENNSIEDVLINISQLSGNAIDHRLRYLIDWNGDLDENGKQCVQEIIREAVTTTLFGMLCVLDGVRAIEDGQDKGSLELYYVKGGVRKLLNDLDDSFLHDLYGSLE